MKQASLALPAADVPTGLLNGKSAQIDLHHFEVVTEIGKGTCVLGSAYVCKRGTGSARQWRCD